MNHYEDPYDVLGISRGSSKDEVKKAFRKKVLACHPDVHVKSDTQKKTEAEAAFRKLKDAYDSIISNNASTRMKFSHRAQSAEYWSGQYANQRTSPNHTRHAYRRPARPWYASVLSINWLHLYKHFRDTGSLAVTLVLGGVLLGSVTIAEPTLQLLWQTSNKGKLFDDMVADINRIREEKKKSELHISWSELYLENEYRRHLQSCFHAMHSENKDLQQISITRSQ